MLAGNIWMRDDIALILISKRLDSFVYVLDLGARAGSSDLVNKLEIVTLVFGESTSIRLPRPTILSAILLWLEFYKSFVPTWSMMCSGCCLIVGVMYSNMSGFNSLTVRGPPTSSFLYQGVTRNNKRIAGRAIACLFSRVFQLSLRRISETLSQRSYWFRIQKPASKPSRGGEERGKEGERELARASYKFEFRAQYSLQLLEFWAVTKLLDMWDQRK